MLRKAALVLTTVIAVGEMLVARPVSPRVAALAGRVSSEAEGFMEGVLVRAKGVGSTITVTVVTDHSGRYAFPTNKLGPGRYTISIRAVGYDLAGPASVEVAAGETAHADLNLTKTENLVSQLTSAEWLMSVPGTERQKNQLYRCAACHSLTPVVQSMYDADSWVTTLERMGTWSVDSVISSPVPLPFKVALKPNPEFAKYLSTINLSSTRKWAYELKPLPRPTGRATRVIITEYDLPGARRLPHDAILDDKGMVWYNDFQEPLIGRLDPRTGEAREWRFPPLKPAFPLGTLTLHFDRDGYLWFPRARQGGFTRFDPRTEKFKTWIVPQEYNSDRFTSAQGATAADGTVWATANVPPIILRLDPKSGHISGYPSFPDYDPKQKRSGADLQFNMSEEPEGHATYGIATDSKSNAYFCDIEGGNIGRVDAKTGKVTLFKTPTLNSGPRRLSLDSQGRVWFGEYYANKLGMFDPKTEQFREWTPPTAWTGAYPAMADKNGEAWTAGMGTDLIVRLDPQTGRFTEYLLPTVDANIRWIEVDNSTTPVTAWVAEVHQGKIAKIEALD
jgi:virginiamycin B lyase